MNAAFPGAEGEEEEGYTGTDMANLSSLNANIAIKASLREEHCPAVCAVLLLIWGGAPQ